MRPDNRPISRAPRRFRRRSSAARDSVSRRRTRPWRRASRAARAFPNPTLTGSYSKSFPTQHFSVEFPIDLPGIRELRGRSARLGLDAARLKYHLARATIALDADTTYTHAVAAREHLVLSRRNALDGDSLLHMVERRRDAGDASDMDVELARVNAGQQANTAAADSLTLDLDTARPASDARHIERATRDQRDRLARRAARRARPRRTRR